MSGDATFSGTSYQARVLAYAYSHIVAQTRLGWLELSNDIPTAASGETRGAGDDIRLEFSAAEDPIEIQAKHGMTAGAKLDETCRSMLSPSVNTRIILVANRGSTRKLFSELQLDLDRLRSGRSGPYGEDLTRLLEQHPEPTSPLRRLHIRPVDVDASHEPEWKAAVQLLKASLTQPDQAEAAMCVLSTDANTICARRLRRTRKDLCDLLAANSIVTKSVGPDEKWMRFLDSTREIIMQGFYAPALALLNKEQAQLLASAILPPTKHRLYAQRALVLLSLGRAAEALDSARRALTFAPSGIRGLVMAGAAALELDDVDTALHYSLQAIVHGPNDSGAWALSHKVARRRREQPLDPPPSIRDSKEYRSQVAEAESLRGNYAEAARISRELMVDNPDMPGFAVDYIGNLTNMSSAISSHADRERCEEIVREATDRLQQLHEEHPLRSKLLLFRGHAQQLLGKNDLSMADLATAVSQAPNDLDAIRVHALGLLESGNTEDAIRALGSKAVDQEPSIRSLRVVALAARKDPRAPSELEAVLALLSGQQPETTYLAVADACVSVERMDTARKLLEHVQTTVGNGFKHVMLGRIAFASRAVEQGIANFREAVVLDANRRTDFLCELARHLTGAGEHARAVQVFDEITLANIPAKLLRDYAVSLFNTGDLSRAQQVIDRVSRGGPLPTWAMQIAANIAFYVDDTDAAVRYLAALVEGPNAGMAAHLALASALLDAGRSAEAAERLAAVKADGLSAEETTRFAILLAATGSAKLALATIFRAFRVWPHLPDIHRALVRIAFEGNLSPREVLCVEGDTQVRLRNGNGETREFVIFDSPPVDPIRRQMLSADAAAAGILGCKVGDICAGSRPLPGGPWTVEEILAAEVHAVHDVATNFSDYFPTEPVFSRSFEVPDSDSVGAMAPLIAFAEENRRRHEEVVRLFRERGLPIGFLSERLGISKRRAMRLLSSEPTLRVTCEWPAPRLYARSVAEGADAKTLILDSSALTTAISFGFGSALAEEYKFVAPNSVLRELRNEAASLSRESSQVTTLTNDHDLVAAELEWFTTHVEVHSRPLRTLPAPAENQVALSELIGVASFDLIACARYSDIVLLSDDLGLRRLDGFRSTSSIAVLEVLRRRGRISQSRYLDVLLRLVDAKYSFVPPSSELLERSLREYWPHDRERARRNFGVLHCPERTLGELLDIVSDTIKQVALSPVQFIEVALVAELAIEVLSKAFPRAVCCGLLRQRAAESLRLLPVVLSELESTLDILARRRKSSSRLSDGE